MTQNRWGTVTLQGINISHLGKRKIIFKSALKTGYVSSLEGILNPYISAVYLGLIPSDLEPPKNMINSFRGHLLLWQSKGRFSNQARILIHSIHSCLSTKKTFEFRAVRLFFEPLEKKTNELSKSKNPRTFRESIVFPPQCH